MNTQIAAIEHPSAMACRPVDDAIRIVPPVVPPEAPHWVLVAGEADTLALLRTMILLARTFRTSIRLDISQLRRRGQLWEAAPMEIHFGASPCNALVAGLLESVGQQLRDPCSADGAAFLVRVELPRDAEPIVVRVGRADGERGKRR